MKKTFYLSLLAVSILTITACSNYKDPSEVAFTINNLSVINIHTEFQKQFLDSEDKDDFVYAHKDELSNFRKSAPKVNKVSYSINSDTGVEPKKVVVSVSESRDMSNPMTFEGDKEGTDIYNLKTGTTYYYQVHADYISTFDSEIKSFTVSNDSPRNLFIEGVENVRDLGGWDIGENKVYKQGLIYRTAQFNYGGSANTFNSAPTELGKKVLLEDLKIKTEIDLRKTKDKNNDDEVAGITSSPLGDNVNYVSCPMVFGGKNVFEQDVNIDSLKLFFNTLADINNYPIAFHCVRGTDRTGALAYILGAIAGMSEEDLLTDYLFSNFARIGNVVRRNNIASLYVRGIANSKGDTYQEKAMNYLIDKVEVSKTTLDAIKDILVED